MVRDKRPFLKADFSLRGAFLKTTCLLLAFFSLSPAILAQLIGGDRIDVTTGREAPAEIDIVQQERERRQLQPFGFNLFSGGFHSEREDGLNPDYKVQPGDRITLKIWGATNLDAIVVTDAQGNIFVPDVGPINVEGVRNADLTPRIETAVRNVFTQNINVYTNLEGTLPVIVYVTGFVNTPGSYAGVGSDSILYFLSRAGGIDRKRGSFREIRVKRNDNIIAEADLYSFLIDGDLAKIQFIDGDTIVVGRRGSTVAVEGAAQNAFLFEVPSSGITGKELMRFARPFPQASHATITGPRSGGPASIYVPLSDLDEILLADGDRVILEADQRKDSILVGVEGSFLGPSRFAVPIDAKLSELLDYIEVDPRLADTASVSVRRPSIAKRQKKALEDSLRRLETAVAGASSDTDEEAKIRAQEAELLSRFIERAREFEPDGVLVVANDGNISDIQLEHGDVVTIPEHTEVVLLSGEVMVPQALIFSPGDALEDYVRKVGGLSDRADPARYLVVRRSGEVIQGVDIPINPGDEIIALPKVPTKDLQLATSITQILFQLALAGATVGALINSL